MAQKRYKSKHDWVGNEIHWELSKRLNFDHAIKCFLHKPESVPENETHKIIYEFDIQTDHPVQKTGRPDLALISN